MKFLIFLFLMACSFGSLLIGTLDDYVTSQTADRLQLYTKQETELGKDVAKTFNELKPQVKVIVENLKKLKQQKAKKITEEIYQPVGQNFVQAYQKSTQIISKYTQMMSDKQLDLFVKDFEKRIKKREKKLTIKRYKKKSPEKFEEIFGEIHEGQKEIIAEAAQIFLDWNTNRHQTNVTLFNALKAAQNKPNKKELIQKAYLEVEVTIEKNFKTNIQPILSLINQFLDTLNKEQKEVINDKLETAIDILQAFIKHDF